MKKLEVVKREAVQLRRKGYSYAHIAKETGISKSTLSGWLAKITYQPNKETIATIGKARAASGLAKSRLKLESILNAQAEAKKEIAGLSERDLFMVGLGLYMGEGSKSHNVIRVVNSNPQIILLAIQWFNEALGVPRENFSLRIHLYPDSDQKEIIKFWSKLTRFSPGQFRKIQVDYRQGKKISKNGKSPHGTAHLSVNSCGQKDFGVFLSRKIEAWSEEIFNNKRVYEYIYPRCS